ncbi:MAG: sugar phosphate isomerase/epimerase [Desulfovibrio sp.]|nr:sugar phosphate isomerase/epimerase [Desulfovibrio sp.]
MENNATAVRIAAPSCVLPATVAENAFFLCGRVDEVCLCLFDCKACLEYSEKDLPRSLLTLPLSWHAHLPCDLPWDLGADAAAKAALAVLDKVGFLSVSRAVLHPPPGSSAHKRRLLGDFIKFWSRASSVPLLLENIACCDLVELGENFSAEHGFGVCLDIGHLLGYDQGSLLASELPEAAELVHWSAPGGRDEHLPLVALTREQYADAQRLALRLSRAKVHLVEVFDWGGVETSLPVVKTLCCRWLRGK